MTNIDDTIPFEYEKSVENTKVKTHRYGCLARFCLCLSPFCCCIYDQ